MSITETRTQSGPVGAGDTEIWVEQRGSGSDVLLIAGLSDPAEAWQPQLDGLADRYRLTAFDNRGSGRTPLSEGRLTVAMMADDAADVLRALGIEAAHVAGFSGGSGSERAGPARGLLPVDLHPPCP